mmetsp:Transcript_38720/g.69720  ORF Transcript_38720/g.69720 Transcript_38720/m.69720 type:complete len:94 (-) Transcript_38720:183-464(-)
MRVGCECLVGGLWALAVAMAAPPALPERGDGEGLRRRGGDAPPALEDAGRVAAAPALGGVGSRLGLLARAKGLGGLGVLALSEALFPIILADW